MLTGSILIIALLSGIPIYAQGVLQRVLTKDLEKIQSAQAIYPGTVTIETTFGSNKSESKIERQKNSINGVLDNMKNNYGLDVVDQNDLLLSTRFIVYTDYEGNNSIDTKGVNLTRKTGLEDHIKITAGRMYEERDDGVVEVIMTSEAMADCRMITNQEYTLGIQQWMRDEDDLEVKIMVVGIFTIKDENDTYWSEGFNDYIRSVFCSEENFQELVSIKPSYLERGRWNLLLNYYQLSLANAADIAEKYEADMGAIERIDGGRISWPVTDVLAGFGEKEQQLSFSLLVIELPVIILLAFYIFMVSQLIMDNEANEIAVLKSRGASKMHIFEIYLLQGIVISAVALIVGPPLGLGMCFLLGGANGFLEFVNRSALQVRLSADAYLYAILAAVFFIVMMVIPAIGASRQTILTHKQQVARSTKKPLWKKLFIDFVLIAIAVYGLYSYYNQQDMMSKLSMSDSTSAVDPLMLLISTIFILGMGLLFLRIFPLIIKLIFNIGKRFWPPSFYLTLTQVSRSSGSEQFLMLFLVFTIGVSIFSANTARTINTNQVDNLEYSSGADIVITNEWNFDYAYYNVNKPYGYTVYKEISYKDYQDLETVAQATRVWKGECENIWGEIRMYPPDSGIAIMTIEPSEFAEVARMRNGLTEYHWYNYCNLLTDYKNVVLLSSNFQELGFKVGDQVQIQLGDGCFRTVVVGSFIDYWPGIDPDDTLGVGVTGSGSASTAVKPSSFFAVTTFDVVFQEEFDIPIQPYEIWMKKAEGASSNDVYNEIAEKGLRIDARKDLTEDTVSLKNDPTLQSMNGALTLCFIISLVVCFAGFLIYWIISINRRTLQFGIIRAIGMKTSSLIGMLLLEQLLISGSSIFAGAMIGVLTSYYYIPIYSMTQSASNLMLPFRIVSDSQDYVRLYTILAIILVIGFAVLATLIKKIKINNALKIGED